MTHKKKKPTKNRTKKRKEKKRGIKNRLFFVVVIAIAIFFGFGYLGYAQKSHKKLSATTVESRTDKSTKELMKKMKKMLDEQRNSLKTKKISKKKDANKTKKVDKKTQEKIKTPTDKNVTKNRKKEIIQNYLSEVHDYKKSLKYTKNKPEQIKKAVKYSGKPRLAIIIDDVSFASQVKMIKKIPFKVTPSFFPPTKVHPDTVKLSKEFSFAMVHLPLEAIGYSHPEPDTLKANDTLYTISKRIQKIHSEFPNISYYNNHTGSKFTSNLKAMRELIPILQKYGINFIDSRTTAATKAGVVCKALHIRLLSRDVFLDNVAKPKEILTQLKRAVKIAKKSGFAIAIGHPHKNTMKTLMGAKKYLNGVKVVYVNEL